MKINSRKMKLLLHSNDMPHCQPVGAPTAPFLSLGPRTAWLCLAQSAGGQAGSSPPVSSSPGVPATEWCWPLQTWQVGRGFQRWDGERAGAGCPRGAGREGISEGNMAGPQESGEDLGLPTGDLWE